jgi:hypothetical protein
MLRTSVAGAAILVGFIARWGGSEKDVPTAMVLDNRGSVIVVGNAYSRDFPTTTGRQMNGNWCAFATKLDARSGSVIYSTALCTRDFTFAFAAAPGPDGEIWVAGSTNGPNLPLTSDAAQRQFSGSLDPNGAGDVMLMRWSADGRTIRYATYFGGSGDERANALAPDGHGGVWVGGRTTSRDLPVVASTGTPPTTSPRGFVAHVDARGAVVFARVIDREVTAMTMVDSRTLALATADDHFAAAGVFFLDTITNADTAVAFGMTGGTVGADRSRTHFRSITSLADRTIVVGGDSDACRRNGGRSDGLVVFVPAGTDSHIPGGGPMSRLCVGGDRVDEIHGLAAASDGSVWVTGLTDSRDFPVTVSGTGAHADYDTQAFVAQIDAKTGAVRYAALLGDNVDPRRGVARGHAIAVAQDGRVFAVGETTGGSLFRPSAGAFKAGQTLQSTDIYVVSLR